MSTDAAPNPIYRLIRIAGTVLAFGLLVYLLSRQGWDEIMAGVRSIPAGYFAAAAAIIIISRLAVAARWHSLLVTAGVRIPLGQSLRISFAGLFASNFLPTTIGGDVVRLAMALRMGLDRVISAASLVVDRLVGMAGMASALPFGLAQVWAPGTTSSAVSLGGLWDRGRRILARLGEALQVWARSPRGLLLAFALTWVHQICIFSIVWLMLDGLGEPIGLMTVGGLWSFTYFVTLLPLSINGLGLQELSMTAIFSTLGGVSVGSAATAALLIRTLQMFASLPGVFFLTDILESGRKQNA